MPAVMVDASVLLAAEDPDDVSHLAARQLLGGDNPIATLDLAYFEVANVAVRAWNDLAAADRLLARVAAIDDDGGVVRADVALLAVAAGIAAEHGISVYDAAYVAAAGERSCRLVSCDVRDLVSRGLATAPAAGA